MVESLESLDSTLPRDATVVSNISLQFLDLYLGETSDDSSDSIRSIRASDSPTTICIACTRNARRDGTAPVPAVVFDGEQMSAAVADSLASAIDAKTPVFLMLAAPESQQYADVLKAELDQLQGKFTVEPVSQNEAIALYRLTAQSSNFLSITLLNVKPAVGFTLPSAGVTSSAPRWSAPAVMLMLVGGDRSRGGRRSGGGRLRRRARRMRRARSPG